MPRSDVPDDVDVVTGALDADSAEELPQPDRRDWPLLRRVRVPLAGAAVAAVLATLAVRALAGDPHRHARPSRPAAVTTAGSLGITFPRPDVFPTRASSVLPDDPAVCPATIACVESSTVPGDVLAAVRHSFPGARQLSATTVLTSRAAPRSGLWFRQLNARAGVRDILVLIRQQRGPLADEPPGTSVVGRFALTYVGVLSDGFNVQIQVDSPVGHAPPVETLRRLATDRRLFVRT